jgi:hypothetical protein
LRRFIDHIDTFKMKGPVSEPNMFDPEVEAKGVEQILAALTEDETKFLADKNMPLRHFRAEKVSVSVQTAHPSGRIHV